MARILGVELPKHKRGEIGLMSIYGIGRSASGRVLRAANIPLDKKVGEWSDEETNLIRQVIEQGDYVVEGALRAEVRKAIKHHMDIGTYRGKRHRLRLPVNGQKTKNNARTRKGKRVTVANKKKVGK